MKTPYTHRNAGNKNSKTIEAGNEVKHQAQFWDLAKNTKHDAYNNIAKTEHPVFPAARAAFKFGVFFYYTDIHLY
jgi:hypothetical protein